MNKSNDFDNPCAVVGCMNEGKRHTCPHDGRLHHHGRIHYDCGSPKHSLEFRKDAWYLICSEHYEIVKREREEWVSRSKQESK